MPDFTAPFALVVDDNPIILMDVADILEDAGFRTHQADDGVSALKVLERHADETTLLFSDVEMPGMNGFELATTVSERWPDVEIVICSGRLTPRTGDLPAKATFVSKPFSAQTIKTHLSEKLPDRTKPEPLRRMA